MHLRNYAKRTHVLAYYLVNWFQRTVQRFDQP